MRRPGGDGSQRGAVAGCIDDGFGGQRFAALGSGE